MEKYIYLIKISCISSFVAIIEAFSSTIQLSYVILLVLIFIDTLTGMFTALKYSRFSSKGLIKLLKKVITYTIAFLTIKLLELGILSFVETTILSNLLVAFLQVVETVSILENLTLLGVPLPANFINFLLSHIRIPGLSDAIRTNKNKQKDISEIDDIINYQILAFNDKNIRELLKIKFTFWKTLIMHINKIFENNNYSSTEHLCYKFLSLIEVEIKDMNKEISEANIPKKYIVIFEDNYRPIVNKWIQQMKKICFSDKPIEDKKNEIIESIVVISYKTILSTHKIFDNQ